MKPRAILLQVIVAIAICHHVSAQTVDDVLEKGIKVDDRSIILVHVEPDGKLLYEIWPRQKNRYRPFSEAPLFLSSLDYAHIYMRPVNPLNFSNITDLAFAVDPIDKAASDAIATIIKTIQDQVSQSDANAKAREVVGDVIKTADKKTRKKIKDSLPPVDPCANDFSDLLKSLQTVQDNLKDDKKDRIVGVFQQLKKMTFSTKATTEHELQDADRKIGEIADYFDRQKNALTNLKTTVDGWTCGSERDVFINKYVLGNLLAEMNKLLSSQITRFNNLKNAYKTVDDARAAATVENEDNLEWVVAIKPIEIKEGQITTFTLTINDPGYTLSEDKEITKVELKEKSKQAMKFRRFQRWVPEVLAGIAYTRLNFPQYSSAKNDAGEEVVTDAGTENVRRLNFTAMVNLNYYTPNSNVHPFVQVGVGANVGYPTLLLGGGLRFKFRGMPAFALSVGAAGSWVQELKTLHVGEMVKGPADVEKDITHTFKSPKIYYGIQIQL